GDRGSDPTVPQRHLRLLPTRAEVDERGCRVGAAGRDREDALAVRKDHETPHFAAASELDLAKNGAVHGVELEDATVRRPDIQRASIVRQGDVEGAVGEGEPLTIAGGRV